MVYQKLPHSVSKTKTWKICIALLLVVFLRDGVRVVHEILAQRRKVWATWDSGGLCVVFLDTNLVDVWQCGPHKSCVAEAHCPITRNYRSDPSLTIGRGVKARHAAQVVGFLRSNGSASQHGNKQRFNVMGQQTHAKHKCENLRWHQYTKCCVWKYHHNRTHGCLLCVAVVDVLFMSPFCSFPPQGIIFLDRLIFWQLPVGSEPTTVWVRLPTGCCNHQNDSKFALRLWRNACFCHT